MKRVEAFPKTFTECGIQDGWAWNESFDLESPHSCQQMFRLYETEMSQFPDYQVLEKLGNAFCLDLVVLSQEQPKWARLYHSFHLVEGEFPFPNLPSP